jgi:hypothetical protein
MNKLTLSLLVAWLVIASPIPAFALECPRMPEQSNKDWEFEVNAAVLKIGPVKGGELSTRTRNATKDLLGKLPQAGRIYLEQMMYSSYCSALRDDKTIRESEKAKLLREYNREVRRTLTTSGAQPKKTKVKSSESSLRGKKEPDKKSTSDASKDSVTTAKPSQPDATKNRKTLMDLYKNDFSNLLRVNKDAIVMAEGTNQTIKSQAYLDFQSQSIFLGFYIPNSPQTYAICVSLANNYDNILEQLIKTTMVEFAQPGMQPVNSSELRFSGRIFLYHEYHLFEEQKRELFSLYKSKGVSPQFRDWKYAYEKNKESLTTGSTGSPEKLAPGEP